MFHSSYSIFIEQHGQLPLIFFNFFEKTCLALLLKNCSETFRKTYNKTVLVAVTSNVQSWKLQITNNEIFVFISVLVFKLLSRKGLLINRKGNRNW